MKTVSKLCKTAAVLVLGAAVLLQCSRDSKPASPAVARVGNHIITADQFRKSYSFGPTLLKEGDDPAGNYLQAMINEELLADLLDARKTSDSPATQREMRLLQQELVVEQVFRDEVNKKIRVSDEEIRTAIIQSAREVKVKYYFTPSAQEAREKLAELQKGASFDSLMQTTLYQLGLSNEKGETGFIRYGEIDEPFNSEVFSLKPGEISDVITTPGGAYILKAVDMRSEIIAPGDYARYHERYRKILENKKGMEMAREFLKRFMDPMQIKVKTVTLTRLAEVLYPLYRAVQQPGKPLAPGARPATPEIAGVKNRLSDLLDQPLVESIDGPWSVGEFLDELTWRPVQLETASRHQFGESLKKNLAIMLRDHFIEKEGRRRGVQNRPRVVEELNRWHDHYRVLNYLAETAAKVRVDKAEVAALYHEKVPAKVPLDRVDFRLRGVLAAHKTVAALQNDLAEARREFPVEIFRSVLDTLDIQKPGVGRLPEVKLFKLGVPWFREAFPNPSPVWAADRLLGKE